MLSERSKYVDYRFPNPWHHLPSKPPFILPSDVAAVSSFNKRVKRRFRIIDHLLPVPYLGLPSAPIVLLNLNPGYNYQDETRQTTKRFVRASRNCLLHKDNKFPFGFYFLDFRIEGSDGDLGPGSQWWRKKFGSWMLGEFGRDVAARTFFCVQYFPYRSREFRHLGIILDSQRYGFQLVRAALKRNATIIIMRSARLWHEAVPELRRHPHVFALKNPRNPTLTKRNCGKGFQYIVRALKRSAREG
jgi:hypothetical protein